MNSAATPTHRTVALIGGAGSGKTTLAEALLLRAGELSRAGSVEQGNTVCDHEPEEIARGMTLGLSLALLRVVGSRRRRAHHHARRHPGASRTSSAASTRRSRWRMSPLVAVSAVDGVTAGTRFAWAAAEAAGVPRIVVVTQEDKARADFRRVLGELQAAFGEGLWALELPLGEEQAFHGIADVLSEQALEYDDGRAATTTADAGRGRGRGAPDARRGDRGDRVARRRPARGVPRRERAVGLRARAHARRRGRDGRGGARGRLLRRDRHRRRPRRRPALQPGARRPLDHDSRIIVGGSADGEGGTELRVAPSPDGETAAARVPHRGRPVRRAGRRCSRCSRASCARATGCTTPRPAPTSASTALFRLRGAEHLPVDALRAGEVGAVAKLTGSPSGSLLWTRANGTARPVAAAAPGAGVRGEPRARPRSPTTRS